MNTSTEKSSQDKMDANNWLPENQIYGHWDPNDDIVISGIAGRFPECDNVEELMENLFKGVDLITENDRRWPIGFCNLPGIGTMKDITRFDATYFGVPPKHVHMMDPQIRIMLEITYEALIDAGINPADARGSKTGVYFALSGGDSDIYWSSTEERATGIGMLGSCKSMFANRIAFHFDFNGPSFAVDSGCATSLVAVNQAVTDMRIGRIDAAVVCASNVMLNPFYSQHLYKLGVLSPETVPSVFDANATGYVRSEAVVVLYLQKKSNAKRVYADILHVRNNTDGFKSVGITYPSGEMQFRNNSTAYKEARIDPNTVGYIEAHGTGTKVGDPEELNALAELFCKEERNTPLLVGSLKSNMGHAESAAGLCSIVKVIIAMHTGQIPPNLHYKVSNPEVPSLFNGQMKVVDTIQELPGDVVGVNAFGFGGTNSHVVLRKSKKIKSITTEDSIPRLVAVSGRTETAVNYFLDKIESLPRDDDFVGLLHDIHSKNIHKHGFRGYTILNTDLPSREVRQSDEEKRPVWFICTGWGAQWMGRTKELMQFEVFEKRIRACSKVMENEGINLYEIINQLTDNVPEDFITVFLIIGATQLALIDLIRSTGIEPDALIGISTGELTCAYIDGAVTAEQVMLVAYHTARWTFESNLPAAALGVVCGLTFEEVKNLCPPEIVVAVHNDARTCTVVGPEKQVPLFIKSLLSKGIVAKLIKTGGVAFHSPHIAKEAEILSTKIEELIPNFIKAKKHWLSSSVPAKNGDIPLVQTFNANYFMNIVTNTVLVHEALQHIPDNAVVVEISPHCALQATLQKTLPDSVLSVGLMSKNEEKQAEYMLTGLGKMYNAGIQMNLASLYPKISYPVPRGTHMIGPLVQWDHSAEWTVPKFGFKLRKDGSRPNKCSLIVDLTADKEKYLKGHIVNQIPTFPYGGYLALIWKGFAQVNENWFENVAVKMDNVEFHEHTELPDSGTLTFVVRFRKLSSNSSEFEMHESERLVATGTISMLEEIDNKIHDVPKSTYELEHVDLNAGDIYRELSLRGFQYSGHFCSLLQSDNKGASGKVEWQNNWVTFLDSLLQFAQLSLDTRDLYLPRSLKTLTIIPKMHLQKTTVEEGIPVQMHRGYNLMKAGGVELQGLQFCMELKNKVQQRDPEIEKNIFIPYFNMDTISLGETAEEARINALTVMIQLVQENLCAVSIKNIVELSGRAEEYMLLAPLITPLARRQPSLNVDVTVVSEIPDHLKQSSSLESSGIKVENVAGEALCEIDCHLMVVSSDQYLENAATLLQNGRFLLLERNANENKTVELPGFTLVATQPGGDKLYYLLRKDTYLLSTNVIKINSQNFKWLHELQVALKNNKYEVKKIVLVTEGDNQCGLLGFMTCLMKEPGSENVSCVFVQDSNAPDFSTSKLLYATQLQKDMSVNIYQNGVWGTMRHIPIDVSQSTKSTTEYAQVEILKPGDLSTISWVESQLKFRMQEEQNDEICQISYASINTEDVLFASGELPIESLKRLRLGQEFSGYSSSGKRVMGLVQYGALATYVVPDSNLLWQVPENWSMEQAATVPNAYATSFYALVIRGHIKAGDWVLIHAGQSAVGMAAIAICLQRGCHVITTVNNEDERKFLSSQFHNLNNSHIAYCNTVESQVLALTEGQGVNTVFNTQQSTVMNQTLMSCLAPDGCFLDLSLPMLSSHKKLGVPTMRNKTYHSIQMDRLHGSCNNDKHEVAQLLKAGLESGVVKPLPAKVYSSTDLEEAFRIVKTNKYTGKFLINVCIERNGKTADSEKITAIPKMFMDPRQVYIIAGGLGGFGMELAEWLVQRGAKKLVLTSRRGIIVGYKSMQIRRWRESGITVLTSTQDITSEEGATKLLENTTKLGPVGGIFILTMYSQHTNNQLQNTGGAGYPDWGARAKEVLKDALLVNQNEENFQEVCTAKIDVTKSLDAASQRLCPKLEYFVVFSSVASGRGNSGQTAYGMANSGMERICEARRAAGFPAQAIQWGAIGDVGVVADNMGNDAIIIGTAAQRIRSCLSAFEKLVKQPHTIVTSHVIADSHVQTNNSSITEKDFLSTVANVLGVNDISAVNPKMGSDDFGIDSLMSTEIRNTLQDQFSVTFSSQQLYNLLASNLKEQSV